LVTDHVDKGLVAGVAEVIFRTAHADGLAALAVQIGPVAPQRRGGDDAERIGARCDLAIGNELEIEIADLVRDDVVDDARAVAPRDGDGLGQAAQRQGGSQRKSARRVLGRVAPHVLGDERQPKRLADNRERRQDRLPAHGRPGDQIERWLLWQFAEFVSRESIDRGAQLDILLDIGLQAQTRRAAPAVAEPNGQRIAGPQIAAADADEQRVGIGPNVETVEPHFELGAVAGFDRGEIRRIGLGELRLCEVGRGAPRHFHHAGIVDAERAGGVDQRELGVGACHKRPSGQQLDRAHVLGKIF